MSTAICGQCGSAGPCEHDPQPLTSADEAKLRAGLIGGPRVVESTLLLIDRLRAEVATQRADGDRLTGLLLDEYGYWAQADVGDADGVGLIAMGAQAAAANVLGALNGRLAPWHQGDRTKEIRVSHVATVDVEIRDLDALAEACGRLGLELARGQTRYRWYGKHIGDYPLPAGFTEEDLGRCDHAVRVPGSADAYEVGVVRRRDGRPGFQLMWDFWAGGLGLREKVGDDCRQLKQAYALATARRQAVRMGYSVVEQPQANGGVGLLLNK